MLQNNQALQDLNFPKQNKEIDMIEFEGNIDQQEQDFIVEAHRKLIHGYAAIACSIPVVGFGIFTAFNPNIFTIIVSIVLVCFYVGVLLFAKYTKNKEGIAEKYFPKKVTIEDTYIAYETSENNMEFDISKIKQVVDYGDFYYVVFYTGMLFVIGAMCQKNLLTKGTLEEFETLFEDKLVRKTN